MKTFKIPIRNFLFHNISKCQRRFRISNGVKILIISIAIFGAGFLTALPASAQVDNLVVEFEQTPLFNEANFLPGEGVSRWVKVTNNSGATQRIATQPLNITDLNRLGDVLNLVIKEGETTLYNNALSNFLANGEVYLSSLANGANTQYDFTISFYSGTQNVFQGKTLKFDILVGFQGTEGGILPGAKSTSGYGGGGPPGMLPPGLTIQNETTVSPSENSVTITWTTSYPASSQVIYALENEKHTLDLTDTAGAPPKYGYARTTPEYDSFLKVLIHLVTIDGLTSGTKYYYRTVSHGSLAISTEHSFTTLTVEEAIAKAAGTAGGEGGSQPPQAGQPAVAGEEQPVSGTGAPSQTAAIGENIPEQNPAASNQSLLAAVGSVLTLGTDRVWVGILVGLIIFTIVVFAVYSIIQRKRKNLGQM